MAIRNNKVQIAVSKVFFDKVFERERKKLERKMNVRLTQRSFTELLAKKNVQFKFPKPNRKFFPNEIKKQKRRCN